MAEKARPFVWLDGEKKQAEAGMDLAPLASGTDPGFMSAADKAKLDELDPDASGFAFHQSVDQTLYWFEAAVNLFRVLSISPTSGDEAGGTEYTITGTGFRTGEAVTVMFGEDEDETATVDNSTTISGTTPAGTSTVDVTVTQGDDSDTLVGGFEYVQWSPALIDTALWLDAADGDTITLDGSGNVEQWDDKSGNNRHATQSSAGSRPSFEASGIGGKGTIRFSDSTKQFFNLSYPDVGSDNRTLLIVAEHFSDDQDLQNPLIDLGDFDQADGAFALTTEPAIRVIGGNRIWGSGLSFSTPYLIAVTLDGSTTDDLALHLNGNLETPTSTATNAINTRGQARIASLFIRLLDGRISEVVVLASAAVDADRQKIEGYLAHKWGLEASLPGGHPYKSSPP